MRTLLLIVLILAAVGAAVAAIKAVLVAAGYLATALLLAWLFVSVAE